MEDDIKISKVEYLSTNDRIFLKFETYSQRTKPKSKMLEMKMTSSGRQPQNIES
jgi:hypothetical protein